MTVLRGATARNVLGPLVRATYRVRVTGGHHLPRNGGLLILSTYAGLLDPTFLATNLARPVAVVVGGGAAPIGWRGTLGRIVVDPSSPGTALRAAGDLLAEGHAVVFFPRGCTPEQTEFASGAAYLQTRARVPVVPIAMGGSTGPRPTDPPRPRSAVDIVVGEAFTPAAVADPCSRTQIMAVTEEMRQRFTDHVRRAQLRIGALPEPGGVGDRHNGLL